MLPNIRILLIGTEEMSRALEIMKIHTSLKPRDPIHAAVCISNDISEIISDDSDLMS